MVPSVRVSCNFRFPHGDPWFWELECPPQIGSLGYYCSERHGHAVLHTAAKEQAVNVYSEYFNQHDFSIRSSWPLCKHLYPNAVNKGVIDFMTDNIILWSGRIAQPECISEAAQFKYYATVRILWSVLRFLLWNTLCLVQKVALGVRWIWLNGK